MYSLSKTGRVMSKKSKCRKRKQDVGGHVLYFNYALCLDASYSVWPQALREHPCVQNHSDDSQCYSGLQALVRDTGFEHDCVYSVCQTLVNVRLLCKA